MIAVEVVGKREIGPKLWRIWLKTRHNGKEYGRSYDCTDWIGEDGDPVLEAIKSAFRDEIESLPAE